MDCQNCAALARENAELRRVIEEQRSKIFWLRQTIGAAKAYALAIYNQAMGVMGQHQPRGTWSYYKGRAEVAAEIHNILLATMED